MLYGWDQCDHVGLDVGGYIREVSVLVIINVNFLIVVFLCDFRLKDAACKCMCRSNLCNQIEMPCINGKP